MRKEITMFTPIAYLTEEERTELCDAMEETFKHYGRRAAELREKRHKQDDHSDSQS